MLEEILKTQSPLKLGTKVLILDIDYTVLDFSLSKDVLSVTFDVRDTTTAKQWKQTFTKELNPKPIQQKAAEAVKEVAKVAVQVKKDVVEAVKTNVTAPVTKEVNKAVEAVKANVTTPVAKEVAEIVEAVKETVEEVVHDVEAVVEAAKKEFTTDSKEVKNDTTKTS